MILKNTKLKNKLIKLAGKQQEVADILVFGSVVRGKEKPNDIDILVIFESKVDKDIEYQIRKILGEYNVSADLLNIKICSFVIMLYGPT